MSVRNKKSSMARQVEVAEPLPDHQQELNSSLELQNYSGANSHMKHSPLLSGLRHHSTAQKKYEQRRRRSRMIQSLVAPQTAEGRDDSGSSLPRIINNEPIVIKNKIYIIEDKYPGKPLFKND